MGDVMFVALLALCLAACAAMGWLGGMFGAWLARRMYDADRRRPE